MFLPSHISGRVRVLHLSERYLGHVLLLWKNAELIGA